MTEQGYITGAARSIARLQENLQQVVRGRPEAIRTTIATLLAEGHLLLEDVPGVGKTTLAKALALSVEGSVGRIQFTPDLLPGDLTGVTVYRQETGAFDFHPGPVFATVVIGDEINRASPKTQSALLECMAERQVTVDGITHALPRPFMVIATQNPVEMEGTYRLPEAQRDRFMAQITVGYPPKHDEFELLATGGAMDPLAQLSPVVSLADVQHAMAAVREVHVADPVLAYVLDLVHATREHPALTLGASPRAGLHLVALARAVAMMAGRHHVIPDDVQSLIHPVLGHRIALTRTARLAHASAADVLTEIARTVPAHR
ncbi:AAA family ATPase [Ruania halotolerans]|uniref:AAA family ATPase n=1 Tax=Ruania halotolerans TaxID=2897773 RepID=UPI001E3903C5|nr:MoxR family ATPase [Ruania halotolerans]UFU05131.1 AAA family ATPase [Ruania halotolerans]